ncbi:MAG: methyltransferase domain-containing protein [Deltaproteobacteria bacterium]|nr:methyltransferase domain-containing protein [Deltaproteobacteria bacterium]
MWVQVPPAAPKFIELMLEKTLLSYIKRTYLPKGHANPKTADQFTSYDIKFFARGVAEMSAYFTSERVHLPKNYLNKKELRAGYLLYFVITNFLKVKFCLNEIKAAGRFKDNKIIKFLDLGSGPGTASFAAADMWRDSPQTLEITAVDQNTNSLHDAKHIFAEYAGKNASLKTIFANLHNKNISYVLKRERFDIAIASNFFNEIGDVQKQAFLAENVVLNHLTENGVLIIIEPALRWTTRNLMKLRDQIIEDRPSSLTILAPCLHGYKCPMLRSNNRDWCHIYLEWHRPKIIEELDKLIGNRKDYLKFSYLIISPSCRLPISPSPQVWRVVSAPMRSHGKIEILLCSSKGLVRATRLDKNASSLNADFDRAKRGNLVSFEGTAFIDKTTSFKVAS